MRSFTVFIVSFGIAISLWIGFNLVSAMYYTSIYKTPFDSAAYSIEQSAVSLSKGDVSIAVGQLDSVRKDLAYLKSMYNSSVKCNLAAELRSIAIIMGLIFALAWMAGKVDKKSLA